jgi:aspartate aminotransferase-like enzyme
LISVDLPHEAISVLKAAIENEKKMLTSKIGVYSERLNEYENKYGMKTDIFLEKFENGELGDEEQWFEWFADADIKKELESKVKVLEGIRLG